jgi:hypothetical protein
MHRLPPDLDLSFFHGKTLLQVCIGQNEMILRFDGDVAVTVTSRIGFTDTRELRDTYEDFAKAAHAVLGLLHDVILQARGDSEGTLSLVFRSNKTLEFYDTSDRYESYLIQASGRTIAV